MSFFNFGLDSEEDGGFSLFDGGPDDVRTTGFPEGPEAGAGSSFFGDVGLSSKATPIKKDARGDNTQGLDTTPTKDNAGFDRSYSSATGLYGWGNYFIVVESNHIFLLRWKRHPAQWGS